MCMLKPDAYCPLHEHMHHPNLIFFSLEDYSFFLSFHPEYNTNVPWELVLAKINELHRYNNYSDVYLIHTTEIFGQV